MKLIETINNIVHDHEFKEMVTKNKELFGSGVEHRLYPSKKYPDRLYKLSFQPIVDKWLELFKNNPKYFPKVYGTGTMKYDKKLLRYVLIEKVDTERHIDEWEQINDALEAIGAGEDVDSHFRSQLMSGDEVEDITNQLKQYDPDTYRLYIKWLNFIFKVNSIVQPYKRRYLDVHVYNFGYRMNGDMVCLDI